MSRHDPPGQLVEEYLRLVSECQPRLFMMENVRDCWPWRREGSSATCAAL